jgi:pimeloyl-ACP methyl ester carboxylesterase
MTPQPPSLTPGRDHAVVFVHGFGSTPACWDTLRALLGADERIAARFDLTCFGYETSWMNFNLLRRIPRIDEVARSLEQHLEHGLRRHAGITLVGHSQGGLVIQRYLANKLQAGKGEDLARIRQVLLIATPNLGSGLMSGLRRFMSHFFCNPQERALRIFDPEISDIRAVISERVVGATARGPEKWPIPVTCFWGKSDSVVLEASARGAFDSENAVPLNGDHFTVLRPSGRDDDNYRYVADALLEPAGHRHVYEIELFDLAVKVEPLGGVRRVPVEYGGRRRIVETDNVARVLRSVTFARKNRCGRLHQLRYRTRNDGYIRPTMSAENEASPAEIDRYTDRGTETIFKFTPKPGKRFELNLDVYRGFDEGHRDIHLHLGTESHYQRIRVRLDLSAYLAAGWTIKDPPRVHLHARDPKDHDLCVHRAFAAEVPCAKAGDADGVFEWELHGIADGVLDAVWDLEPARPQPAPGTHQAVGR